VTLLLIGIAVWTLVAIFACSLGRVARMGDRLELERARGWSLERHALSQANAAPSRGSEEPVHRELLAARRALRLAEARLARLEGARRAGAA